MGQHNLRHFKKVNDIIDVDLFTYKNNIISCCLIHFSFLSFPLH